jgi:hypothetical protein
VPGGDAVQAEEVRLPRENGEGVLLVAVPDDGVDEDERLEDDLRGDGRTKRMSLLPPCTLPSPARSVGRSSRPGQSQSPTELFESRNLGAMLCAISDTVYSPSKVPWTSGSMYCDAGRAITGGRHHHQGGRDAVRLSTSASLASSTAAMPRHIVQCVWTAGMHAPLPSGEHALPLSRLQ